MMVVISPTTVPLQRKIFINEAKKEIFTTFEKAFKDNLILKKNSKL